MSIGGPEIIILFLLALIFFGPNKLPEIGRNVGRALRELKRMSSEVTDAFEDALNDRGRAPANSREWEHPDDERYLEYQKPTATVESPYAEAKDSEAVDPYKDNEDAAIGEEVDTRPTAEDPEVPADEAPLEEPAAERTEGS